MLFNSYVFIFAFLPIVWSLYVLAQKRAQLLWPIGCVVLGSLVYYAWWKAEYLILLLASVAVNYVIGRALLGPRLPPGASRALVAAGVIFNLGLLGYYKYAGFFVANVNGLFGGDFSVPSILLPIGISFFTFQQIAFLVDARRGEVRNFTPLNYVFFVTFFPQLIAGPIVHHSEVMPQLDEVRNRDQSADLALGISIFIVGLFKKVVIADTFAIYADAGYASLGAGNALSTASAWVAVLSYSFQLYYDFSGYSDMAVGLARMFGIRLPVNFYSPYKATSIIDFWRRWHMTLSRFLRDYLYIPLGGSRLGAIRRAFNIGIVMLLGGMWHGASWNFMVWGGVHGLLLALNHGWNALPLSRYPPIFTRPMRVVAIAVTFLAVTLAWVPFRAATLGDTQTMLGLLLPLGADAAAGWGSLLGFFKAQFGNLGDLLDLNKWAKARELWPPVLPPDFLATARPAGLMLLGGVLVTFLMPNTYQFFARFDAALDYSKMPQSRWGGLARLDWRVALVLSAMFVLCVLRLSRVSPFLYFQF